MHNKEDESGMGKRKQGSKGAFIAPDIRYHRHFETSDEGILILDPETGKILDVNPFLIDLLGYSKEEIIDKEIWEIGFLKDIISSKNKILEIQQKGFVRYENLPFETAEGIKIEVEFISNLYVENNHNLIQCNIRDISKKKKETETEEPRKYVAIAFEDITERKLTEASSIGENLLTSEYLDIHFNHSYSETRYCRFFESSKDGILILNAETGRIIDVNPFLTELLGCPKQDFIGKVIWGIGFFRDIIANEEQFLELQQNEYLRYDNLPIETADKLKISVEFVSNVFRVRDRKVIQCHIRDITKRRSAENALISSESRLHTLIHTIPDLIWTKDPDGIYLSCNTMFSRYFGASEAEIVGKTDYDFVARELADFFREHDLKAMAAGKPTINEEWITFADDGHLICIETIKAPFYDSQNKIQGVLGIGRDITQRKYSEKALSQSEEKFRSYIDHSPDGIFVVDETGRYVDVNESACMMSGFSRTNLLKMLISDLISEESFEESQLYFNKLLQYGTTKGDFLIKLKDGSKRWWSLEGVKLNENRFLGFAKDITERKQSEEEIAMLSSALKSVNECVSITDLDNTILFVNESFLKTYGYEGDELIGEKIDMLNSRRNEPEYVGDILQATIQGGWKGEMLNRKKDGSEFPIYLSTSVVRDKENKVLGLIGVATDITERRKAENELKDKNMFIQTVMDNLPIGISLNEIVSGSAFYANKKFEEIYGWPLDEMKNITDFFKKVYPDKTYRDELAAKVIADIHTGDIARMHWEDCKVTHKDGSEHFINAVNIPLFEQNTMVSTVIDVTERRRVEIELIKSKEKAVESDRLKSAFLANVSHEIRTPMNGILGFTGLLKEPKLSGEEQQEYIRIIEKSGERMLNIINDIVNISKIEAGQMEISVSETNINENIEDIYYFFRQEAELKNLKLLYMNSLPANEAIIRTDKGKFEAILSNLIKNAIKFTDKGSIEFGYRKKGDYLEFYVKDTGIGVSQSQREVIFERFRQGSESRTRNYEGAGLGLAISKAYVEMLGGEIHVASNPDKGKPARSTSEKGSTFIFTIPYTPAQEMEIADKVCNDNITDEQIGNLKVLIAEDDEISQILVSIITKRIAKEIIKAGTGTAAVEACRNNPDIDLVLMDIKMPEMDGYEATRQIRKFNKKVVIIAQTAYGLQGDNVKAIEAGCNDYISKPVDPALLMRMIENNFLK